MPPSFRVTGGRPLSGTIRPAGNKNAALPILAATLLADGPCRIDNVPRIRDVETLLALLQHLGASVQWHGANTVEIDTSRAEPKPLDPALCKEIRASILLAGPMLARFLVALGAAIDGIGSNTLTIEGGRPLKPAPHTVGPDHIEIGSFIGLAAVTGGAITIDGVRGDDLRSTVLAFERLGVRPRLEGDKLIVDAGQERRIRPDLGGHVPKLEDGPWPAFPADLMSIAIVVATQCEGLLLVFEKLFESRLFFVDKLIGMGARIVLCDPHRAVIAGPSALRGQQVESPDIRAGMAMLLAALAAQGDSVIQNIGQIERGYEHIDDRLRALGAQIERRT